MLMVSTPSWAESRLELSISSSSLRDGTRSPLARSASDRSASSASTRSSQTDFSAAARASCAASEPMPRRGAAVRVEHAGGRLLVCRLRDRGAGCAKPRRLGSMRVNETLSIPNSLRNGPDERGRFGEFGGRFVAETLMPLILEVEQAYEAAKRDPEFRRELDLYLRDYVGRPSPLWFAERLTARARRRARLFQARRAQPHRRAQGQQLHGPDPAGPAHGQDPHHRRDRRRPARRRHRHGLRPLRPALHHLHGRDRRRAAEAQRVPHEAARRRGAAGRPRAPARSRTR